MKKTIQQVHPTAVLLMMMLIALTTQFGSDNFLPSLPAIANYFSVNMHTVQWAILTYMLALGVGQLFYGSLSDFYGRKPLLMVGFGIFIIGCIVCVSTPNIGWLLVGRALQGFGMGCFSIFRAVMTDRFEGKQLATMTSYIQIVFSVTPIIAPITGGYIEYYLGWRYNFGLMAILGIGIAVLLWLGLPESLSVDKRKPSQMAHLMAAFKSVVTNRTFVVNMICASMAITSTTIYITITPFLYQHSFGLSPIAYGWMILFTGLSMMLCGVINARLFNRWSSDTIMLVAGGVMLCCALIILLLSLCGIQSVWAVVIPAMPLFFCLSLQLIHGFINAFKVLSHVAGMASSIYTCIQVLLAALVAVLATTVHADTAAPLALLLLIPAAVVIIFKSIFK